MNNKMNVDFHTMDEMPFVDAPVYGRKLHGNIKNECDSVLVFWRYKNYPVVKGAAMFSGIVEVESIYDEDDHLTCVYHTEDLPPIKNKTAKETNIELVGWCELPIDEANRLLQEAS